MIAHRNDRIFNAEAQRRRDAEGSRVGNRIAAIARHNHEDTKTRRWRKRRAICDDLGVLVPSWLGWKAAT